jgi:long-chain alkane monooxygenase
MTEGVQGTLRALAENASDRALTFGELVRLQASTRVVGTPEKIAEELERWAAAGVDGFNVSSVITPGTLEDFVDHAVPLMQARGLMQREYAPGDAAREALPGARAAARAAPSGCARPCRRRRAVSAHPPPRPGGNVRV